MTGNINHRHLRVGELVKQNLGQIFLRNEAKIPTSDTNLITVTEVRMSTDLKSARAYVIPLGGKETKKVRSKKHIWSKNMHSINVIRLHRTALDSNIYSDNYSSQKWMSINFKEKNNLNLKDFVNTFQIHSI